MLIVRQRVVVCYFKFAGEKTPTQSSLVGSGDSTSTVTHSVSSPWNNIVHHN